MKTAPLFRFFPTPRYLEMPAAGLDIGDKNLRLVILTLARDGFRVAQYAERPIPESARNAPDLTASDTFKSFLSDLREEFGIRFINASIPEEKAYLFKTEIPHVMRQEIRSTIEFRLEEFVPISTREAVFDYDIINTARSSHDHLDVSVSVLPRSVVDSYSVLFAKAGLVPLSFEIEGQALVRAVLKKGDERTILVVHFGDVRTGIYIVSSRVVHFTSTIPIGGESLTSAIRKNKDISVAEAEEIKKTKGFSTRGDNPEMFFSLVNTLSVLRDEINRVITYWNTHSKGADPAPALDGIIFSGEDAGIPGFLDYLSLNLKTPLELANIWTNIAPLDQYIPPIHFTKSLSYGAAVGLALFRGGL